MESELNGTENGLNGIPPEPAWMNWLSPTPKTPGNATFALLLSFFRVELFQPFQPTCPHATTSDMI
jgi:hypothetical protein